MTEKILAIFASIALFIVVGSISYKEFATNKVVVDVQLRKGEDPFQALKSILPADATVVEIKETDRANNKYEMTINTHRQRYKLLEWIRSSSRVEKVEEAEECQK